MLVRAARRQYFFGDEWAFLIRRDLGGDSLLEPHNEHWSTLPLLAYRAMFHIVGIDHHLAYAMGPIILHVGICLLLQVLLRRHGVPAWPAVLATLLLAFLCGNIGENPLWAFQIGFLGSCFFGLLALVAYDAYGPARRGLVLAWAASFASMLCSGMAVPMLIWLGAAVLMAHGLARALLATVPPFCVYLLWYLTYGNGATKQAPAAGPDLVLEFTWAGIASIWQLVLRVPATGGAFFLVLVGLVLLARLDNRVRLLALSGLATVLATFVFLGVSRAGLGVLAATASRYAYFGVLFTLPAVTAALMLASARLADRPVERRVVYAVLVVLFAVSGTAQTDNFATGRATVTAGLEQRVLAAAQLVEDDARLLRYTLDPGIQAIAVGDLKDAAVRDALPDEPVGPQGRIDAEVQLQVASSSESLSLPAASGVAVVNVGGTILPQGCSTLTAGPGAYLDIPPTARGSQVYIVGAADLLPSQLVGDGVLSLPVSLAALPGTATFVGSTAQDATLRINLPAGELQLCQPT